MRLLLHILLCAFCALCVKPLSAQEEFIEPSRRLARLPFRQLTGGVVLLRARLDPFPDTLQFILDTGSGGISLDSTTVDYLKLKPTASNRTIRGIGGIRNVAFVNHRTLQIGGLPVDSLNFHINDYSILTSVYGEPIDGIIGYSLFSRYIVKVNYDSSFLELWSKGAMRYPRGGYLLRPQLTTLATHSFRLRDERTLNTRFLFDLGAGLCIMLSTDFIRDSAFLSRKRKLYVKEAEGMGGKIDMQMTVVKEVKLGPYRFRNVPAYVFEDTYNVTSYPYLGGLLGSDLLRRFNLIINYPQGDIYLVPNRHFNEPFDYAYTGLELYLVNGLPIIGDVAVGSPAEAAGLKEGDIVVGINRVLSGTLQQYKAALQTAGDRLRMIIRRDGELMEFNFKVKSILSGK